MTVTLEEIELLAQLLARAGVTQIEAVWANGILDKLRVLTSQTANPDSGDPAQETPKSGTHS